ncbi:MAG: single-stranded-DNA-specific exonuclease [bacterium P3]|nr:MAG: single-stranded-DNA-specific exonuclease [bacterium P3]KWW42459.1 MAG: single-stranded-DNA-specific exonuclease [bacterium F083]
MKQKRWLIRNDYDVEVVEDLAEKLNVDPVIATLLVERGVTTFEEARRFFRPSLEQLHDPFLMRDMHQAIARIEQALQQHERIMVYGDYDVDGTSAVALLYSFLQTLSSNLDFYIPDREAEGYGISLRGIDYAHETGVRLIIALDCGIKAVEQVDYAAERGIDFIIGDHHLPGDTLPRAIAVLDPKRSDCPYPYKELSGCGIGFKIVEAYMEHRLGVRACDNPQQLDDERRATREKLMLALLSYLDLVAVSIASDIVPITDENRVLATYGLKVINTHPRPGIEAILRYGHIVPRRNTHAGNELPSPPPNGTNNASYFEKELTIADLVFLVGPRINAAGRIHSAFDSVRLLLCDNKTTAATLAEEINNYNLERKGLDTAATEEAKTRIESDETLRRRKSIVLFGEDWHKGVVGIVASRLVEAYYKPTIIFTRSTDDMIVGSARSIKEFDVHTALEQCSGLLEHFGGHRCAAGVSLKPENLELFIERFEEVVSQTLNEQDMVPEVEVDAEISFSENLTPKFLRILKQFAPFGPENNVPVFLSRHMVDTGHARIVGNRHLKFAAIQLDARSHSYPAIAFQMADCYDSMRGGQSFDLCYQLEENYWNGKTEIQLNVKDIRFDDDN